MNSLKDFSMHFRMHFRFLSDPHLTQRFLGHQKKRCVNIKKLVKPLLYYTWQKLKHQAECCTLPRQRSGMISTAQIPRKYEVEEL